MEFLKRTLFGVAVFAMVMTLWLATGCENNNNDVAGTTDTGVEFRLDPSGFNMGTNVTQIALRVIGGSSPFTWTMSAPTMGTLGGNDAVSRVANYTATANQNGVNTVRVQDSRGWIASSVIVQGDSFRLDPSDFNMGTNVTQIVLTVIGGISPFTWTMSSPTMGTLGGNDALSRVANYTATTNQTGVNTVRVQDSQGWMASSVIVQGQ
jgi:hypothetical protein